MRTFLRFRLAVALTAALGLALVATLLPGTTSIAGAQTPAVVINEFVAANDNGLADNTGQFEDWIELHNTSGATVSLTGWTLADGDGSYTFGTTSIPGNGYLVVIASDDVSRTTSSQIHLPFKLSADGEPLTLRNSSGALSSPSFAAPGYPALPLDTSYGRDGNNLAFFASPTPGSANSGAAGGLVQPVSFSVEHGFYTGTQSVILNTSTSGATIRYTLDASTPTSTSGIAIAPGQAVSISETSTLRAIAYRTGWIPSSTETRSYFFTSDIVDQSESTPSGWPADRSALNHRMDYGMDPNVVGANRAGVENSLLDIPTISIVTDQSNLTSTGSGIYVNPTRTGFDWERPASVELIDPTGAEPGFETNAGLRIRGGGSRNLDNPKHSLRLYFRNDYGDGDLEYEVFGPGGVDRFESFGLATGQHGSWSYRGESDATWIRDLWTRRTQAAMGQPDTDSRYFHLYLNGLYWGIYIAQERLSGGHGEQHFGGGENDYDVISSVWRSPADASDGTIDDWASLYPLVEDLTITDTEFAAISTEVDLENLAVYYLLFFFSGERDGSPAAWSYNGGPGWQEGNNWRAFRNRNGVGGAGKWLFYDHDSEFTLCALGSTVDIDNTDWNLELGLVPSHQVPTPAWLHQALTTHPAYRQIFRDQVAAHMQAPGGALTTGTAQALVDELTAAVDGAILAESARWGDSLGDPANTVSNWQSNITTFRNCVADRFSEVQAQLEADGLWPTDDPPVLAPAPGAVAYGTNVTIDANGQPGVIWYTLDGSDPRATNGQPRASAMQYSGPIQISAATTVRARVFDASTWTPVVEGSYTLSSPAGPVRLLLNEYNAVGGSKFLGGGAAGDIANGTDPTLGRVPGNGGDWFEVVALEELDIAGWTFEVWHRNNGLLEQSAALEVTQNAPTLQRGTILTVSEDIADDVSFAPQSGDWHINFQANASDAGAYFTPASQQNFAIDNDDTQIAIFDETGAPVALRTGEGTVAGVSIGSEEVFKLEADPSAAITFDSADYNDGTSSTWGLPNRYGAGADEQDLSSLRVLFGDVDCSNTVGLLDARNIAQFSIGVRTGVTTCPLGDPATHTFTPAGDVDGTGTISLLDARLVAQCAIGVTNQLCP